MARAKPASAERLQHPPRLLSEREAAAYCGVSVPTFRSLCPFRPVRLGSRVLFDVKAIDAWIDLMTGRPDLEIGDPNDPTIESARFRELLRQRGHPDE